MKSVEVDSNGGQIQDVMLKYTINNKYVYVAKLIFLKCLMPGVEQEHKNTSNTRNVNDTGCYQFMICAKFAITGILRSLII